MKHIGHTLKKFKFKSAEKKRFIRIIKTQTASGISLLQISCDFAEFKKKDN